MTQLMQPKTYVQLELTDQITAPIYVWIHIKCPPLQIRWQHQRSIVQHRPAGNG